MVDIQSAAADIRRGKKGRRKKKPQGKNIMACPITQGDHSKLKTSPKLISQCMPLGGLSQFPFNSTAKIALRMHQNSPF